MWEAGERRQLESNGITEKQKEEKYNKIVKELPAARKDYGVYLFLLCPLSYFLILSEQANKHILREGKRKVTGIREIKLRQLKGSHKSTAT